MSVNYTAKNVVAIAQAELGYLEKASNNSLTSKTENSGYANYTQYAADLDKNTEMYNGKKNGYEWCDVFVDWCHVQAAIASGGTWHDAQEALCQPDKGCGAGCEYSYNYYKAAGRTSKDPQVGAQIFFCSGSEITHTGLVTGYDDTYVYTIEGNTRTGNKVVIASGGGVYAKSYFRSSGSIYGYGLPKYAEESKGQEENHDPRVAKGLQKYKNSTGADLPVYSGTRMDKKTGSLNPEEKCYCFGKVWSKENRRWMWLVCYTLDGYPSEWKTGYVDYGGGTTF